MVTKTPWFVAKTTGGWGWTPATWQGWTVTAVFVAAMVAASLVPGLRHRLVIIFALMAALILVGVVTGTKPGGNL